MKNSHNNSIVAEIHNHASSAQEKLLAEAKNILKKGSDELHKNRVSQLAVMGFTNFKEARQLSSHEIDKAQELQQIINEYKVKAPLYHFMTDDAVTELLLKYGLVQGPVSSYIDSIPEKNQRDILNFKIDESFLQYDQKLSRNITSTWRSSSGVVEVSQMDTTHLVNTLHFINANIEDEAWQSEGDMKTTCADMITVLCSNLNIDTKTLAAKMFMKIHDSVNPFDLVGVESTLNPKNIYHPRIARVISLALTLAERKLNDSKNTPDWRIIAAPEMFDMKGLTMTEHRRLIPKRSKVASIKPAPIKIPDPIVQVKVKSGWLNVTAWGEEAQFGETFDYSMN